jgi:hypothetical protein
MNEGNGDYAMSYFETHVARELAQKRPGDRKRRSEASFRLYWATYKRLVTRQTLTPHGKSQVWTFVRQLLGTLQKWWTKHVLPDMRVGKGEVS